MVRGCGKRRWFVPLNISGKNVWHLRKCNGYLPHWGSRSLAILLACLAGVTRAKCTEPLALSALLACLLAMAVCLGNFLWIYTLVALPWLHAVKASSFLLSPHAVLVNACESLMTISWLVLWHNPFSRYGLTLYWLSIVWCVCLV